MEKEVCSNPGCRNKVYVRGLCNSHYKYFLKTGRLEVRQPKNLPLEERLNQRSKVNAETGCIEWTGSKNSADYGMIGVRGRKLVLTHRLAWELKNGEIPSGMYICHKCDNPPCMNTDHLFLGAPKDNSIDRNIKGRQASHKGRLNGRAKLTEDQVMEIRSDSRGHRKIAIDYKISAAVVLSIRHGRSWAHLPQSQSSMEVKSV